MRPYCVILWQCLTASGPPVLPRNHKTPMGWLMGFSGFGPKSPTLLNKSKGNKNQRRVWRLAIWHRKLMDQEVSILENRGRCRKPYHHIFLWKGSSIQLQIILGRRWNHKHSENRIYKRQCCPSFSVLHVPTKNLAEYNQICFIKICWMTKSINKWLIKRMKFIIKQVFL